MDILLALIASLMRTLPLAAILSVVSYFAALKGVYFTPNLWSCCAWSFLVAIVLRTTFNGIRNPLKKFPVEKILDIRVLFPVTNVPRGRSALEWAKRHQDEDVVRVSFLGSTVALLPLSVTALRDVLSTKQLDFEKPLSGRNYLARSLGYGLVLSEGDVHARQRKHLMTSFRVQNIRALHQLMLAKADVLMERMDSEWRKEGRCDVTTWGSKVTLDIIGPTLMNTDFQSLTLEHQPVHDAFTKLTATSPMHTLLFALSLVLPKVVIENLPLALNSMVDYNVRVARTSCRDGLSRLRSNTSEDNENGEELDSTILTSITKDPEASDQEIIDQMMTFLGAGHETTATSIAWVTHFLTLPENSKYQDLLREEVLSSPDCTLSPTKLEALPWLNAICEETLRLFPPVTTTARKAVRDTSIAGIPVPRDTLVIIFPWAHNRDPRHWGGPETAEKFIPERWIDRKDDGSLHINNHGGAASNFCNMTFLQGNRGCIGKGFAKAELRVIVAKLFGTFRVRRLSGDDGKVNPVGSLTIKPEGGLNVSLEKVA